MKYLRNLGLGALCSLYLGLSSVSAAEPEKRAMIGEQGKRATVEMSLDDRIDALEERIKVNSQDRQAYVSLGDIYYNKGDDLVAKTKDLKDSPNVDKEDVSQLQEKARKQYSVALDHYLQAHKLDDDNLEFADKKIAASYQRGERYQEGVDFFKDMVKRFPKSADMHNDLGLFYDKLQKFNNAELEYQKAIELDSKNSIIRLNLGVSYFKQRKYDKVVSVCNDILKYDSKNSQAIRFKKIAQSKLD